MSGLALGVDLPRSATPKPSGTLVETGREPGSGGVYVEDSGGHQDPYEHVATILTNVTRLQRGRELVLVPGRGALQVCGCSCAV
jgi:hypothetical protein